MQDLREKKWQRSQLRCYHMTTTSAICYFWFAYMNYLNICNRFPKQSVENSFIGGGGPTRILIDSVKQYIRNHVIGRCQFPTEFPIKSDPNGSLFVFFSPYCPLIETHDSKIMNNFRPWEMRGGKYQRLKINHAWNYQNSQGSIMD